MFKFEKKRKEREQIGVLPSPSPEPQPEKGVQVHKAEEKAEEKEKERERTEEIEQYRRRSPSHLTDDHHPRNINDESGFSLGLGGGFDIHPDQDMHDLPHLGGFSPGKDDTFQLAREEGDHSILNVFDDLGLGFGGSVVGEAELEVSEEQEVEAEQEEREEEEPLPGPTGFSKNTLKALKILRSEFTTPESSSISFEKVATKASRRAASSFFFELLVLGTRDCLKLEQEVAFGDIRIASKGGLWDVEA